MDIGNTGKEMMSDGLQDVMGADNSSSEDVVSVTQLILEYSEDDVVTVPCTINTLALDRVDVDGVPAKIGVEIFQKYLKYRDSASYKLECFGERFELGRNVTVYGFYTGACSLTFSSRE